MACDIFRELLITDGTTPIDLLNARSGFNLEAWQPSITEPKGGGVWADSALADGRRLKLVKMANVIETYTLTVHHSDADALIRDTQELRRLLEKARSYWTTDWQDEPVWLEAVGVYETNKRYALIMDYRTPADTNPYAAPFWMQGRKTGIYDFDLIIEREPFWRSDEPGTGTCVEIAGYGTFCWPYYIEFNGTITSIVIADNAAIQDLVDAAVTWEGWFRPNSDGENNLGQLFNKTFTRHNVQTDVGTTMAIDAEIVCAVANAQATSNNDELAEGEWSHIAITWDDATYNYPRIWVNGAEVTYAFTQNRNGAITSDVGRDLYIGNRIANDRTFDGDIGWTRISDIVRYNAPFTPPARCHLPDIDVNTVGQWIGAECSGATIDNQEGTAAIDGTLSNGSFDCDCDHTYGNVDEDEVVDPNCEE